jgi:hypothetical protein
MRSCAIESARGSPYEAHAGLRVATAWGYTGAEQCAGTLVAMDRLGARIHGLSRR